MADPDLNPYNFVPLEGEVERKAFPGWHRLEEGHLSGILECELEALTPLFTADHQKAKQASAQDRRKVFPFLRNGNGVPILQGTTIRGMIRAVYEAAFSSCLPLVVAEGTSGPTKKPIHYQLAVPSDFERCKNPERLCPACRLFGVIEGDEVHARGRISFSDAVLVEKSLEEEKVYLRELSSPKPHHYAIYSRNGRRGGPIRGRKLFYHHDPNARPALTADSPEWTTRSNAIQEFAPTEARFAFKVQFHSLTQDELRRLVGCLLLDAEHAHKIGMAKPQGYGSCRIHVLSSRCWRGADRYRDWGRAEEAVALDDWTPAPDELERLLRHPSDRVGTVGYLAHPNAYQGTGIDQEGRFIQVPSGGTGGSGFSPPPPRPTRLATLNLESLQPARNPAQERPEKRFKKGDTAKILVMRVEQPGRRYLLQCKDSGQDDIVFEADVTWQEGQRYVVKIVSVEDGRIKTVKWPP